MTTYAGDKYAIRITQGNDWDFPVTMSTRLNGVKTPIDLTSATITGRVRPTYTTGLVTSMVVTPVDLVAGKVRFALSDTQTDALPPGNLVYQIDVTIAGNTQTYLSGNFIVKPKVAA